MPYSVDKMTKFMAHKMKTEISNIILKVLV